MAKVFSVLFLTFLCFILRLESQTNLGIKGGVNFSNQTYKGFPLDQETNMIVTYQFGFLADIQLNENLFLEPGLVYNVKGVEGIGVLEFKSTINYLVIPVTINVQVEALSFGIGGYWAYGLGGTNEDNGQNLDLSLGEETDDHYSSNDYGLILQGGYNISKIRLIAGFEYGIKNILPSEQQEIFQSGKIKNFVLNLGVAYFFN